MAKTVNRIAVRGVEWLHTQVYVVAFGNDVGKLRQPMCFCYFYPLNEENPVTTVVSLLLYVSHCFPGFPSSPGICGLKFKFIAADWRYTKARSLEPKNFKMITGSVLPLNSLVHSF